MTRVIKIVSNTESNTVTNVESSATTWGELKADLDAQGIKHSGLNPVLRAGKVTLTYDESQIPEGDQIVFLSPIKVKSGYVNYDEFDYDSSEGMAQFAQAIQADMQKLMSAVELLVTGKKAEAAALITPEVQMVVVPATLSDEDLALLNEAKGL